MIMGIVLLTLAVSACTTTSTVRTARLYALNAEAKVIGDLQATYAAGNVEVTLPSGEVLSGEYVPTHGGSVAFTPIFAGANSATATTFFPAKQRTGIATLTGDQGTRMYCEYVGRSHGGGKCITDGGAEYSMHY